MRKTLDKLPQAECDVLLSGIALPDGNGWDLLPLVDADLPRPTHAVAMSGHMLTATHVESEQADFRDHRDRPIDPGAKSHTRRGGRCADKPLGQRGDAL